MASMTSHERFKRMYEHREADRVPIIDGPWNATIERWQREGMPKDMPFWEYFDLDRTAYISVDNSPRYESRVIEETEAYTIRTTPWGSIKSPADYERPTVDAMKSQQLAYEPEALKIGALPALRPDQLKQGII